MSNCTINGLAVISARVQRPRAGNWVAELVVDVETAAQLAVGAAAALVIGDLQLSGTVVRGGAYAQKVSVRVVGGKNGLGTDCKPRFYRGTPLQQPLLDVLKDAGESLSADASQAVLTQTLEAWAQLEQRCGLALSSLASAGGVDVVWRVNADGTVFLGKDGFAPTQLQDFELIDSLPLEGLQLLAAESPDIHPGESFQGLNVSDVEHTVDAGGSRVCLWFEP